MNSKNNIVSYALVGLAAGTVAWLLFGTKGGREQLGRANDGIRELSKTIRKNTKEGMRQASKIADKAHRELDELKTRAKSSGKEAVDKADQFARKGAEKAKGAVKTAARKTRDEI